MIWGLTDGSDDCHCHRCHEARVAKLEEPITPENRADWIALASVGMIVCGTCGNKRCPKASDHDLACTDSNEPGQPGSIYEKVRC